MLSFTQKMFGVGLPLAPQSRTAVVPFSTTFNSGYLVMVGKPAGRLRSEKRCNKIHHELSSHSFQKEVHFALALNLVALNLL